MHNRVRRHIVFRSSNVPHDFAICPELSKAAGKALRSVSVPEVEFAYPQLLEPRKDKPSRDGGPARAYPKLSGKQGDLPSRQSVNGPSPQIVPIFFWRRNFASVPPTDA
jgi:hypothetical protein